MGQTDCDGRLRWVENHIHHRFYSRADEDTSDLHIRSWTNILNRWSKVIFKRLLFTEGKEYKQLYGLYSHGEEINTPNGPFNSIQQQYAHACMQTHTRACRHTLLQPWTSALSVALWLMSPLHCCFCPWNSMSDLETHSPTPPRASALHPTPLLYLKPLPVRLHLQHHAGVGFGEGVAVRDAPAGNSQLHFGQTWRADEAQSGLGRLIDVTHAEHTITHWKERERGWKQG